ncbi:MAG: serine hydrolase [Caulobacterales bacterium]
MSRPDRPSRAWRLSPAAWSQIAALAGGLIVVLFLATQSLAPFFATRPRSGSSETEFKAQLDRAAPRILHDLAVPGVVVATIVGGSPSHTYAYGYANLQTHRPMTSDTVFRVASISKSLTAWGVMRLAETGKVDFDRPVEQYIGGWPLPPSPFASNGVTVRRLLSHTSGVSAGADEFRRPEAPAPSAREFLRQASGGDAAGPPQLVAPPGQAFVYSVPGYMLLQMMIERQSHRSFQDYMRQAVLAPLGMTSSSFDWDPALRGRTATPYLSDGKPGEVLIPEDTAADSLFATAPDLARFVAAPSPYERQRAGPGALRPDSANRLYSSPPAIPQFQLAGLGQDQPALGCFTERTPNGPLVVTNGGYDPGWSSQFFFVPHTGDGIVILTNSDRGETAIAQIAAIWSAWRGLPPMKMTRAYRVLGVDAAVVLGLLAMISISFAADLITEVRSGVRRFGDFHAGAIGVSVVEGVIALGVMVAWMALRAFVASLPAFEGMGSLVVGLLAVTVVARMLFPSRKKAPARRSLDLAALFARLSPAKRKAEPASA